MYIKLKNSYYLKMDHADLNDFDKIKLLGRGGSGEVYLVEKHDTNCKYAMKITKTDSKRALNNALIEKDILIHTHHPFVATLFYSFQSDSQLYMIMPYCECGNFYNFMKKQEHKCFNEEQTTYYASCILLALEYLHFIGVIYRDLKLENILVCLSGRILLSDFDLSIYEKNRVTMRTFKKPHSNELGVVSEPDITLNNTVGTPEYFAPEIVDGKPYTCIVDWWAFGVLIYEMFHGYTPFYHKKIQETYNLIRRCDLSFPHHTPQGHKLSNKAKDIIKDLLKPDPHKRLGFTGGAAEIKCHAFFSDVKFQLLLKQDPADLYK